uniref:Ribonuclease H-like domain-containing protein n=1 Tax=Tanacetum cinerariifolium TaxID=118510 RepID=A0A6L2K4H5_TANCI|nr:ribonuclease H-like domain-containing protein [Tanacetum cinerariifolium]
MIRPDSTNVTLLSDKLSLVTHHHHLTRVPVKPDFENWNYGSLEFFFDKLCYSYEVSKYIHGSSIEPASSTPTPLTQEELKVEKIVLSWIFTTLSDPLQARLVWILLIVKEVEVISNAPGHYFAATYFKGVTRSIKLGDLSMESYSKKIESIVIILTSLDSHVNDEDVVLPDKYDQVCGIMHHKDTILNLKTACSMLITKEMHLNSKSLALPIDSSSFSLMVHVVLGTGVSLFMMQMLRVVGIPVNGNHMDDLVSKLLEQLGLSNKLPSHNTSGPSSNHTVANKVLGNSPVAYHAIVGPQLATTLPHAFTAGTLHDSALAAWNMNTVSIRGTRAEHLDRSTRPDQKTRPTGPDRTYFGQVLGLGFWTNSVFGPRDHGGEFDNRNMHTLFAQKGFHVQEHPNKMGVFISKKYVVEILERAHMVNCNPSRTPVDTKSKIGIDGDLVSDLTLYLVVYSNADWAGCPNTQHSTLEAEYRSVANVVAETFQHQCTKHIEIDIHFVRDLVDAGQDFRTSLSAMYPPAPTVGEC